MMLDLVEEAVCAGLHRRRSLLAEPPALARAAGARTVGEGPLQQPPTYKLFAEERSASMNSPERAPTWQSFNAGGYLRRVGTRGILRVCARGP